MASRFGGGRADKRSQEVEVKKEREDGIAATMYGKLVTTPI